MKQVLACIGATQSSAAVCDCAAWASRRLEVPLTLLHVLDRSEYPTELDLSGNIGLGSREHLLEELASLDEKRGKVAIEAGRAMLDAAAERVQSAGGEAPALLQRHGDLAETLAGLEQDIRLLVIGLHRTQVHSPGMPVGGHVENVVRTMHRPILVIPGEFSAPKSLMLAFDGSETTRKGAQMLADSPLFLGLPLHLVMVGQGNAERQAALVEARSSLEKSGHHVEVATLEGEVEPALHAYQQENGVDLLVMGAYGHSRIRQLLVGSTTRNMLNNTASPVLLLR
ncbi:universal stress protein [Marinobacterium nitratireducens]|uniref:Universal stress protein n=1 Tax=Marinobacterium nitratireducens TaxID=518897 RepID=A0A917ZFQ0_9GAMM|nr:universal stress protein [Marinobacterium nitratireducens]GGO82266.1 universal stress protein [Marinobacterium nitratireducens]